MTELGLSIGFAAGAASAGRRWLRIEQVRADSQAATLADAARLIDALFDTDPCDQGTEGTGGASAKEPPDEEKFSEAVEKTIDLKQLCDDCEYWETAVDVFRSHQSPDFRLVSETAEISDQREMVSEAKTETFQLSGDSSVDLSWPYHSGLRVSGATVAGVSGSTVVFGAPVYGSVQVGYQSLWQRVTVRVPAVPADNGVRQAEPAAVVCFWADLAAACELVQPENEDEVDAEERQKLCRKPGGSGHLAGSGCWETVEHYSRCNCSGREAPGGWSEVVPAPCPDGIGSGAHLGTRREFAGYTYCEGEEDEVNDPEYYKRRCCVYPPRPLPRCRETRARWSPGAEIDGGAAYYQDIYGPGVQLTAVSPEQGDCGEKIWSWDTSSKNCCDDITPLSPSPQNPEEIRAGESHEICVLDGRPGELKWTATGGLYFLDKGLKTHRIRTDNRCQRVYAERFGICPTPRIRVDDGCKPVQMVFQGGGATPPRLPDDMVVAPEQRFYVSVYGGVPPYRWQSGEQIRLLSWDNEDGATALFEASADFCGTEVITVVDACHEEGRLPVRSTRGTWEEVTDFDPCQAPWEGVAPNPGTLQRPIVYQGVQALIVQCQSDGTHYLGNTCADHGSCQKAWQDRKNCQDVPCEYSGIAMVADTWPCDAYTNDAHQWRRCYNLCTQTYWCRPQQGLINNLYTSAVHYVSRLWRWSCEK